MKNEIIEYLFEIQNNDIDYNFFKQLSLEEKFIAAVVSCKGYHLYGFNHGPFTDYNLGRAYYSDYCKLTIDIENLGFLIGYNNNKYFIVFWYLTDDDISFNDKIFTDIVENFYSGFTTTEIDFGMNEKSIALIKYFNYNELVEWVDEYVKYIG